MAKSRFLPKSLSPKDRLPVSAGFIYNPLSNCYDENKDTGTDFCVRRPLCLQATREV